MIFKSWIFNIKSLKYFLLGFTKYYKLCKTSLHIFFSQYTISIDGNLPRQPKEHVQQQLWQNPDKQTSQGRRAGVSPSVSKQHPFAGKQLSVLVLLFCPFGRSSPLLTASTGTSRALRRWAAFFMHVKLRLQLLISFWPGFQQKLLAILGISQCGSIRRQLSSGGASSSSSRHSASFVLIAQAFCSVQWYRKWGTAPQFSSVFIWHFP